jgi:glycosyltransferase involved in cell wall biosynthesis
MQAAPLISIIMPFLNVEGFIQQAIESVLSQTESNWELLLVDDGSIDNSTEIALEYANRHPERIRYLQHEGHGNLGASASRNLGGHHARGKYIAYLDSDDMWFYWKLEEQRRLLETVSGIDMIVGATKYWWSWQDTTSRDRDIVIQVGAPQDTLFGPGQLLPLLYPLGSGAAPSMNTVIVRSDLLRKIGGWVNSFRLAYTDQAFLVKCYLHGSVYIASNCWDMYRQRPDSSSQTALAGRGYQEIRSKFLLWFEGYLRECGLEDSEAARLLRQAMWVHRHPMLVRALNRVPPGIRFKSTAVFKRLRLGVIRT